MMYESRTDVDERVLLKKEKMFDDSHHKPMGTGHTGPAYNTAVLANNVLHYLRDMCIILFRVSLSQVVGLARARALRWPSRLVP